MRALVSVSDKRGAAQFAAGLMTLGVEVFSTGNTQRTLAAAGVHVQSVSDLTGFPEILDGRVKTLHPAIHAGILARRDDPLHTRQLADLGLVPIDLVVVNLYPFAATAATGAPFDEVIEQIDIGGPALLRAAAKNHAFVLPVVDPDDYLAVLGALRAGDISLEMRRHLAARTFAHTAAYDAAIAAYMADERYPASLTLSFERVQPLRYGENPHQTAALYREYAAPEGTIVSAQQIQGKELSYNNILDADAALQVVQAFSAPTVTIIKHANPCGLASDENLITAHRLARAGDPISAFGGIVAINRPVEVDLAQALAPFFYEVVLAPDYTPEARAALAHKTNLRLLMVDTASPEGRGYGYRRVSGGVLVQEQDDVLRDETTRWRVVSRRQPSPEEWGGLEFAWKACAFVHSNAIVLAHGATLVGMGAGQPSRVDAVLLAIRKAGDRVAGSVLASDAFFPKPDGIETAASAGVTAIIQPGGSQADPEIIATADRLGLAMVFTGTRHFLH